MRTLLLGVEVVGESLEAERSEIVTKWIVLKKRTTSTSSRTSVPALTFFNSSVASHSLPSSTPPAKYPLNAFSPQGARVGFAMGEKPLAERYGDLPPSERR